MANGSRRAPALLPAARLWPATCRNLTSLARLRAAPVGSRSQTRTLPRNSVRKRLKWFPTHVAGRAVPRATPAPTQAAIRNLTKRVSTHITLAIETQPSGCVSMFGDFFPQRNLTSASVVSLGRSSMTQCPASFKTTTVTLGATNFACCPSTSPRDFSPPIVSTGIGNFV
jgi:hypothetical protein